MKPIKEKNLNPGDKVKIKTKDKEWQGHILESHDSEVILLKLESGYNIGIRESDILNVKVLEKTKQEKSKSSKRKINNKLKNIALIITGGTISSRLNPKTGAVDPTDIDEILKIAPELSQICNITKIEFPFLKFSENMSYQDWKILAKTSEKLLNNENIDGIIITHGTDTLHYTSSALSLFLQNLNKPIALTYSQRSIDRGSTDAHLNLICAARYAISDIAEIALVGHKNLHDKLCLAMPGTKVRKMHTSRRDTFKVINDTPIAEISPDLNKDVKILKNFNARNNENKVKLNTAFLEKVALIKIYPGQDPKILNYYAEQGYKGMILELTGLGHTPTKQSKHNWIPVIKKLINKGIIICGAPQTLYGRLNPNVYSSGRELQKTGLIFLNDMLPETALIKLSWVLGHKSISRLSKKQRYKKAKQEMLRNIAGELNPKLTIKEDF